MLDEQFRLSTVPVPRIWTWNPRSEGQLDDPRGAALSRDKLIGAASRTGTIVRNNPCRPLAWAWPYSRHAYTKGWIGEPSARDDSARGKERRQTNP